MPLRTETLPRMAGHLTFMRAPAAQISSLRPGTFAALGIPIEAPTDPGGATRFGPLALRETSAYFGSHFASNMKAAMDVDRRRVLDGSIVAGRLVDLGDLGCAGLTAAEQAKAIEHAVAAIAVQGALPLVLGGDHAILPAILSGIADTGRAGKVSTLPLVVVGMDDVPTWDEGPLVHLAPSRRLTDESLATLKASGGFAVTSGDLRAAGPEATVGRIALAFGGTPMHVAIDMSCFAATWHGMNQRAPFSGLTLREARDLFSGIGALPLAGLSITGLDPTASGLSVVKTGQRLVLTAILDLIYARLGALSPTTASPHA